MSVFVCDKARSSFSIYFLLDFTAHTRSIFKIFTSMNLRNGSFLKPFNKRHSCSFIEQYVKNLRTFFYIRKTTSKDQCPASRRPGTEIQNSDVHFPIKVHVYILIKYYQSFPLPFRDVTLFFRWSLHIQSIEELQTWKNG